MDHYFLFTLESQSFDTVLVKNKNCSKQNCSKNTGTAVWFPVKPIQVRKNRINVTFCLNFRNQYNLETLIFKHWGFQTKYFPMLIPVDLIKFNRSSNTLVSLRNTNDCHVILKLTQSFTVILQKSSLLFPVLRNLKLFDVFRGYKNGTLRWNG